MVFRSRIDTWLVIVLVLSAAVALSAAGMLWRQGYGMALLLPVGIVGIGAALPIWILAGTRYSIVSAILHIRSGPFTWQIPIASITNITPSHSLISSPALSLRRLRVEYGAGKSVLVSPVDHQAFIHAIESARNTGSPSFNRSGPKSAESPTARTPSTAAARLS